jgi:excinuclease UvrABC helicase subunit UvrB
MGESINRDMQFPLMLVDIFHRTLQLLVIKVQASKMPCIRIIFKADINRIRTIINGGFQRWQTTSGTQ